MPEDKSPAQADSITLRGAFDLALCLARRYELIEGRPWNAEGATIELMRQSGRLAKYVMRAEHYYAPAENHARIKADNRDQIGAALADMLITAIRLADFYGIDLAEAHLNACRRSDDWLKQRGV